MGEQDHDSHKQPDSVHRPQVQRDVLNTYGCTCVGRTSRLEARWPCSKFNGRVGRQAGQGAFPNHGEMPRYWRISKLVHLVDLANFEASLIIGDFQSLGRGCHPCQALAPLHQQQRDAADARSPRAHRRHEVVGEVSVCDPLLEAVDDIESTACRLCRSTVQGVGCRV